MNKATVSRKEREAREKQARLDEMAVAIRAGTLVIRHDESVKRNLGPRSRRSKLASRQPRPPAPRPVVERRERTPEERSESAKRSAATRRAGHKPSAPDATTKRGKVYAWLLTQGPATPPMIAAALGFGVNETRVALIKLSQRGFAERTGRTLPSPNSRPHVEWRVPDARSTDA